MSYFSRGLVPVCAVRAGELGTSCRWTLYPDRWEKKKDCGRAVGQSGQTSHFVFSFPFRTNHSQCQSKRKVPTRSGLP